MAELPEKAVQAAAEAVYQRSIPAYGATCAANAYAEAQDRARVAGEAMVPILAEHIAEQLDAMADYYLETVFPSHSDSRDAISGTAMRHAYRQAAKIAREAFDQFGTEDLQGDDHD